jgi:hypothetical protein
MWKFAGFESYEESLKATKAKYDAQNLGGWRSWTVEFKLKLAAEAADEAEQVAAECAAVASASMRIRQPYEDLSFVLSLLGDHKAEIVEVARTCQYVSHELELYGPLSEGLDTWEGKLVQLCLGPLAQRGFAGNAAIKYIFPAVLNEVAILAVQAVKKRDNKRVDHHEAQRILRDSDWRSGSPWVKGTSSMDTDANATSTNDKLTLLLTSGAWRWTVWSPQVHWCDEVLGDDGRERILTAISVGYAVRSKKRGVLASPLPSLSKEIWFSIIRSRLVQYWVATAAVAADVCATAAAVAADGIVTPMTAGVNATTT